MNSTSDKIRLSVYLMDGTIDGRIKCSQANRTCITYKIPRTMINKCLDRSDELQVSGIYFLFGTDEFDNQNVYIGQAINRKNKKGLLQRALEHLNEKEYWREAIFLTTSDNTLGATEICYLENFFYNLVKQAKRYNLLNNNTPNCGNPTEEEKADLDDIINCSKAMIGILGHKVFESISESAKDSLTEILTIKYKNCQAKGYRTSDGFVLLKGSTINPKQTKTCPYTTISLRQKYADKINSDNQILEDILFTSPSAAASFVAAASVNGYNLWKNSAGMTLKEFENLLK